MIYGEDGPGPVLLVNVTSISERCWTKIYCVDDPGQVLSFSSASDRSLVTACVRSSTMTFLVADGLLAETPGWLPRTQKLMSPLLRTQSYQNIPPLNLEQLRI